MDLLPSSPPRVHSADQAARITSEVADALDAAHQRGLSTATERPASILLAGGHPRRAPIPDRLVRPRGAPRAGGVGHRYVAPGSLPSPVAPGGHLSLGGSSGAFGRLPFAASLGGPRSTPSLARRGQLRVAAAGSVIHRRADPADVPSAATSARRWARSWASLGRDGRRRGLRSTPARSASGGLRSPPSRRARSPALARAPLSRSRRVVGYRFFWRDGTGWCGCVRRSSGPCRCRQGRSSSPGANSNPDQLNNVGPRQRSSNAGADPVPTRPMVRDRIRRRPRHPRAWTGEAIRRRTATLKAPESRFTQRPLAGQRPAG